MIIVQLVLTILKATYRSEVSRGSQDNEIDGT